ncbi:ThiF family adenylyltransferase [Flavobacterium sp. IMCC34852]|uniref:ThiF family adenylyltransferase n=1 Tax=Flavobacterium rivulicola TaxID=2732161 RepID=A0A7Y3R8Y7_9FLAO|nr:ThiF family adenylyltransferase [Flavobacterium sp. IMCC34852]NNT71572.1 ThiF family adenylyltransferase [Flavobacterium sp. IMCC34852]
MRYQLKIAGKHFKSLQQHLFPGDGMEAVAVVLCGRYERDGISILLTHKIELIPHDECNRDPNFVHWKTERIIPLLEQAEKQNLAILKIHSHPAGYLQFSKTDDESDNELFQSVFGWCDYDGVHASAVMLPDGKVFGRIFTPTMETFPIDKISIAGDTIRIIENETVIEDDFSLRTRQTFGDATYQKLKQMKIGIIGCSGTGSPTIEQLVRLGVGTIVIIDPDIVENKNLNRILNTTIDDAEKARLKTDVLYDTVNRIGLGTTVIKYGTNIYDSREALDDLITCDAICGCVDSVDGRHLMSQLTNFYLVPYFDIGVRLDADGSGGIKAITASIHYIQPGCSTLFSRKLYTSKRLADENLRRQSPEDFKELEKQGYVHNANVDRPAVISINMQISSMAVNELLNRLHPFKDETPENYAKVTMDYTGGCIMNEAENDFEQDTNSEKWVGRGDCRPFLRLMELQ